MPSDEVTDMIHVGDGWEQSRVNPRYALKHIRKEEEWELQERFLESYRKHWTIKRACLDAMIPTSRFYSWKRNDARFRAQFDEANEEVIDLLEDEAKSRAVDGRDVPMFYEGKIVGWKNEVSDALLMFLLKGHKPETYRDKNSNNNIGESTVLIIPSNSREANFKEAEPEQVVRDEQSSNDLTGSVNLPER